MIHNGRRQTLVVQRQTVTVQGGGQAIVAGAVEAKGGGEMTELREGPDEPRPMNAGLIAAQRCGARRKCNGLPCLAPAMANGRCHKH